MTGLKVAVSPAVELTESATVSPNPSRGKTVIVAVPEEPALTGPTVERLEAMLKSTTVTVMVAVVWEIRPLVAVTVTS